MVARNSYPGVSGWLGQFECRLSARSASKGSGFAFARLPACPTFACTICDIRSRRWQPAAACVCWRSVRCSATSCRSGRAWTELPGDHHQVSQNASTTAPAKLLAVFVVDTSHRQCRHNASAFPGYLQEQLFCGRLAQSLDGATRPELLQAYRKLDPQVMGTLHKEKAPVARWRDLTNGGRATITREPSQRDE